MIITLGRNIPNGKYAVVIERDDDGKTYIKLHKQEDGFANLSGRDEIARILVDENYLLNVIEYYKRLNIN